MNHNGTSPAPRIGYLLMGLSIGSLVGILCAPKPGEETREFLVAKVNGGREYTKDKIRELQDQAKGIFERSQGTVAHQGHSIKAAMEAGLAAFRKERAKPYRTIA